MSCTRIAVKPEAAWPRSRAPCDGSALGERQECGVLGGVGTSTLARCCYGRNATSWLRTLRHELGRAEQMCFGERVGAAAKRPTEPGRSAGPKGHALATYVYLPPFSWKEPQQCWFCPDTEMRA